jgi:hypothetical protein
LCYGARAGRRRAERSEPPRLRVVAETA